MRSLKRKIALNLSIAFSLLFGIVMTTIYVSFNSFRREEFKERFVKRLDFTTNFISQSDGFKEQGPIVFSENADNILFDENIIIFDARKQLLYSTLKDQNVSWENGLLARLDREKTVYTENTDPETYAALRRIHGKNYYIITSAIDTSGQSKLAYLKYLLVFSYLLSIALIWFFCYYIIGRFLEPLEKLKKEISEVTAHKLTNQIPVKASNDEIGVLAQSFNTMIVRLNDVFQSQKDFTASASHEIRTPLTRMAFQLENLKKAEQHSPKTLAVLTQISKEVFQLSDLTNSLLVLTKFDKENIQTIYEEVRIDEVIFDAYQKVEKNFPKLKMDFQISDHSIESSQLTIQGVKSLLEIVFINLFKNAAIYTDNDFVNVTIEESLHSLTVNVLSFGSTISAEEQKRLFDPFMRGSNSQKTSGSGLGLKIVKRILEYHKATITYQSASPNQNIFMINFPL
ncbi:HAMP domain-containing protein [Kaistella flava (ex Peng et al. 2021)]|uniref:histidine kinase n=1 Tax=Kaistella flava (ex Peng et al. 2021) TaxID=2038776 RepID=A0A7M2YBC9_9FLAO|nr:ATP-binding protein [Kaistella flava (ex Peng et al. 2021)]QOW10712.1 HAMP domain-containing protein [Kaistella flava (ex Peng et al. 2021)]